MGASLDKFFNEGVGRGAIKWLRNGAVIELHLNDEIYTFEKIGGVAGRVSIKPGKPERSDIALYFTKDAVEYVTGSKDQDDVYRRMSECILYPTSDRSAKVKTFGADTWTYEFCWKGYPFFLRRIGFFH